MESTGMSLTEAEVKKELKNILLAEGSKLFADFLDQFDLQLTGKSQPVAAIDFKNMTIILNKGVQPRFYSLLIRHEILHQLLKHHDRIVREVAHLLDIPEEELLGSTLDEINQIVYSNAISNIAGDYEISNRGYSAADKEKARKVIMNGEELKGLVTEDAHPEWVDLTLEEMYRNIIKEKFGQETMEVKGTLVNPQTFIDENGIVYGI